MIITARELALLEEYFSGLFGAGDVVGDGAGTDGHVAVFDGDIHHIRDGGAPTGGGDVSDTGATTANHLAVWNGASDHTLKDGGAVPNAITTLTSDVTATGPGSVAATIAVGAVTLAKMADMATASLIYRKTADAGAPEVNSLATLKTDLRLTGTNSGDQVVPANAPAVAHQVLEAYNSTTGAWTQAQLAAADISGLGVLATLGAGASQYQIIVTGATPFTPVYSGFLLDGTTGGKTVLSVTNTKTLTLLAADTYTLTVAGTASISGTNTGDQTVREVLVAIRTYYVRTDGHDAASGLNNTNDATTGAFLTIQHALDKVVALDLSIYNVTIQVADGTYTGAVLANNPFIGSGTVIIQGNNATPKNVVISTTDVSAFTANFSALIVHDLQIVTAGANNYRFALIATNNGSIHFQNIDFGACAQSHVRAEDGGVVTVTDNYTISGAAQYHFNATNGLIRCQNKTITISNTPAFSSAFAFAQLAGVVIANGVTFAGSTTGKYFDVETDGTIFTNSGSLTYFPGNAAGTISSGGVYDTTGGAMVLLSGASITFLAGNIITDTTTGTQIGTASTQKLSFYGATPIVRPSAYTQTYSTTSKTVANMTASNPPSGGTGTAAGGYDTSTNRNLMITSLTAVIADVLADKKVIGAIIDDLQALGLFA